jgi:hypothetical protein
MSFYLSILRNRGSVAVDLRREERLVFRPVHSTP